MIGKRTILVVDDAEDCGEVLEVALQSLAGFAVKRVRSAEAALKLLSEDDVAALVTDVQLGPMSGLELVRRARSVPTIVVSAVTDSSIERQALEAGATTFFAKPFSPSAVRKKVEELLKESVL
jgi:DNA-binding response OmpR family regulator